MKNLHFIKAFFFVALIALTVISCNKKEDVIDPNQEVEVSFSSTEMPKGGTKSSNANATANYASVVISGTTYTPSVYYLDGVAYTQGIKLAVGDYNVTQFLMMSDNNTPNDMSDDSIVSAAPEAGSQYAGFVSQPLDVQFHVAPFQKNEIPIEVLSFTSQEFQAFVQLARRIGVTEHQRSRKAAFSEAGGGTRGLEVNTTSSGQSGDNILCIERRETNQLTA